MEATNHIILFGCSLWAGCGATHAQRAVSHEETDSKPQDGESTDAGTPSSDAGDASDASDSAKPVTSWALGLVDATALSDRDALQRLTGEGSGPPVVTSNNPEVFTGDGLLFGTARASAARGGSTLPLEGTFGVYLHHLNDAGSQKVVTVMITNPNEADVIVEGYGSGYTQTETGGLGLGTSPDYRVSEDWITSNPRMILPRTTLAPFRPLAFWQTLVNADAELDGRFSVTTSAPVYVYIVATSTTDLNEAILDGLVDAPGSIAVSGDPPPPYGREAGVYEHDTWVGEIELDVPAGNRHIGFWVNTATGTGAPQVQAFAALMNYDDSARESVGNYGNVYDLTVVLNHDGLDDESRRARVWFASLSDANPSRLWDGVALVDDAPMTLRNTPDEPAALLATVTLMPKQSRRVRLRAMVPGLTSIPQALFVESTATGE